MGGRERVPGGKGARSIGGSGAWLNLHWPNLRHPFFPCIRSDETVFRPPEGPPPDFGVQGSLKTISPKMVDFNLTMVRAPHGGYGARSIGGVECV